MSAATRATASSTDMSIAGEPDRVEAGAGIGSVSPTGAPEPQRPQVLPSLRPAMGCWADTDHPGAVGAGQRLFLYPVVLVALLLAATSTLDGNRCFDWKSCFSQRRNLMPPSSSALVAVSTRKDDCYEHEPEAESFTSPRAVTSCIDQSPVLSVNFPTALMPLMRLTLFGSGDPNG